MLRLPVILPLMLALMAGGYMEFVDRISSYPANSQKADAIIVLTGGSNRLARGMELLRNDRATRMLISGVNPDLSDQGLKNALYQDSSDPACCIFVGREAADTVGNAMETARWIMAGQYRRLHIVTSAYHMPRALLEFRRHLPDDAVLIPQPVQANRVHLDEWWQPNGSSVFLLTEYTKFLIGSLRLALFGKANIDGGILPTPLT